MQAMMQEMADMMSQMQEMMDNMQAKMSEMMGGEEVNPIEKQKRYLAKPQEERAKLDEQEVMARNQKDEVIEDEKKK